MKNVMLRSLCISILGFGIISANHDIDTKKEDVEVTEGVVVEEKEATVDKDHMDLWKRALLMTVAICAIVNIDWKKNIILGSIAYVSSNMACKGWNRSAVNQIVSGGLSELGNVTRQAQRDISDVMDYTYSWVPYTQEKLTPVARTILYGTNDNQEVKAQPVVENNPVATVKRTGLRRKYRI